MSALTQSNDLASSNDLRKQRPALLYLLVFVFVLFIGILLFCAIVTKSANPVQVDANGKAVTRSSESSHH